MKIPKDNGTEMDYEQGLPGGADACERRRERVYAVVECIPWGRVASYGRVAELAGLTRGARFVGYALRMLPPDSGVPWHRVVNAAGRVSARGDGREENLQESLLESEGVQLIAGRVDLHRSGWSGQDA